MNTISTKKTLIGLFVLVNATFAHQAQASLHIDEKRALTYTAIQAYSEREAQDFEELYEHVMTAVEEMLQKPKRGCIDNARKHLATYKERVLNMLENKPECTQELEQQIELCADLEDLLNCIDQHTGSYLKLVPQLAWKYSHLQAQRIQALMKPGNLKKLLKNK